MTRYLVLCAVLAAAWLAAGGAARAEDKSDIPDFKFPVFVWLDAYGQEPEEYAYWQATRWEYNRFSSGGTRFVETGTCCPSVLREVQPPGYASVTFEFFDENDRRIRSVYRSVYVDEYGVQYPEGVGASPWRNGWWHSRYGSSRYFDNADQEKSLYEYPWPELELTVDVSGQDPWTAECRVTSNIPDKWFQSFEWDLNHDGVFNKTSGRSPECTTALTLPGTYIFAVRATDMRGYSATVEYEFSVAR